MIGELAASLDLVPPGTRLSAAELAAGVAGANLDRALGSGPPPLPQI